MEEEPERDDRSGETHGEADSGLREVSRTTAASGPPSPTRTTSESVARGRRTDVEISANGRRRARTLSLPRRRIEPQIPLTNEEFAAAIAMLTPQLPVAVATTAAAPAVAPAVVATEAATPSPTSRLATPDEPAEVEKTSRKGPAAAVEDTPSPRQVPIAPGGRRGGYAAGRRPHRRGSLTKAASSRLPAPHSESHVVWTGDAGTGRGCKPVCRPTGSSRDRRGRDHIDYGDETAPPPTADYHPVK
ncbi:serine/arginine repetitive matrix protein 1-like [Schistocerca nitens]|uniref:serine/arginine repetitive matrix protein 1-like n=1 Tax=Schistocerca nitens TaxID=7011 RepID=UPI002117EF49|nr:serine/arginine repetitive matrix protein 1-like [Schistocerca nitens]